MKPFKILLIVGILLFLTSFIVSICCESNDNENFSLHPALLYLIKYYNKTDKSFSWIELDSFQYKDYKSVVMKMDNDPLNRFYMVIKFFKYYDNLYFTLWQSRFFPEYIRTIDNIVQVDVNNMYYFELGNINLIILDFPESEGHGFYLKDTIYNKAAIHKKEQYYNNIELGIITSNEPVYETYLFVKDILIRVNSIIPTKYETELEIKFEKIEKEEFELWKN